MQCCQYATVKKKDEELCSQHSKLSPARDGRKILVELLDSKEHVGWEDRCLHRSTLYRYAFSSNANTPNHASREAAEEHGQFLCVDHVQTEATVGNGLGVGGFFNGSAGGHAAKGTASGVREGLRVARAMEHAKLPHHSGTHTHTQRLCGLRTGLCCAGRCSSH